MTAMMRQIAAMDTTGRALSIQRSGPRSITEMTSLASAVSPSRTKPRKTPDRRTASPPHEWAGTSRTAAARARKSEAAAASVDALFTQGLFPYRRRLATSPATMGTMIMLRIDNIMVTKSTGTSRPASVFIQNGVASGERSVDTDVIVTARGTFPPAR